MISDLNVPFEKVEEFDIWPGYLLHCKDVWTLNFKMSGSWKRALESGFCSWSLWGCFGFMGKVWIEYLVLVFNW